ncbi:MAG: LD-carboxypeptidase [Thermoanaerobaculia bacterium]
MPPPVRPGDRIGIAALSGRVDGVRLADGIRELERLGFTAVPASNLASVDRIFAGTDDERLRGFHELLEDPSLGAILFARGGHGLLRILDRIDWRQVGSRPRAFVGYSDLTPLLTAVGEQCGLATFHGPMVASDLADGLTPEEEASLLAALAGESPFRFPLEGGEGAAIDDRLHGVLEGGCLSLLAADPYPVATRPYDRLLFLEDVDEPLYRLDRMLTQLRRSGSLAAVQAMILSTSIAPDPLGDWLDLARDAAPGVPLFWGLASGHRRPNLTVPLGLPARIDVGRLELVIGED